MEREEAIFQAGRDRMRAILMTSSTTIIGLAPLALGGSRVGGGVLLPAGDHSHGRADLVGRAGIAIALALVCSLFSSLTLIPLMSSRFLPAGKAKPVALIGRAEDRYVKLLKWTLRHKYATFFLLIAASVVGFLPFSLGWVETSQF